MASALDSDLPGFREALDGQFALERELGRGGMGVVFLARDLRLDRPVAIKVLPAHLAEEGEVRERFLREARTAGQLSHPNIVPIYRADERGGFAYFAMAFVDGESLADRIRDRGTLTPADTVRWLREVAWALAYAHARGVIHRDVKPENIMIERGTNRALVTDFGIARRDTNPGITSDGHVVGTAYYMSPEQISAATLDGRSDLYSLGVVGFYALSGRLPFDGGAAPAVLVAHMTQPAPSLAEVAPQVPRSIAAVIDRCLSKNPDDRYATGEALADALGKALATAEAEANTASSQNSAILSEEQAAAVWRRAAQLQAEAATRLERQSRETALGPAVSTGASSIGTPTDTLPASGYKARDVEAAAVEAGISQRFVALAISELPQDPQQPGSAIELAGTSGRVTNVMLGETRRSLSISRVINRPAAEVLRAIGRKYVDGNTGLELRETIGGHPLDGGVLVFDLPSSTQAASGPFRWTRWGVYAKELRVTLRPLPHDPSSCEVVVWIDLRSGQKASVIGYGAMCAAFAGGGSVIGAVIGFKALGLAGAALIGPIGAGIGLAVGGGVLMARAFYRYSLRETEKELQRELASLEASVRSEEIFGARRKPPLVRAFPDYDPFTEPPESNGV